MDVDGIHPGRVKHKPGQQEHLTNAVHKPEMWPTPRHEGFDAGAHRGNPDSLHSAVKMLPTPRAIYGEHPGMTDTGHLTGIALLAPETKGMKLNSAWVSRMMGFPDDWLTLDS